MLVLVGALYVLKNFDLPFLGGIFRLYVLQIYLHVILCCILHDHIDEVVVIHFVVHILKDVNVVNF